MLFRSPKVKPPLRRYQSQPQAECSHKVVDINSPKSSVLRCQNTRYSRATSLPVQSSQPHQTATAPANAIKATLDMSAKSISDTAEGPLVSNSEALPLVRSIKKASISDATKVTVGLSLVVGPLTSQTKPVETISQNPQENATIKTLPKSPVTHQK